MEEYLHSTSSNRVTFHQNKEPGFGNQGLNISEAGLPHHDAKYYETLLEGYMSDISNVGIKYAKYLSTLEQRSESCQINKSQKSLINSKFFETELFDVQPTNPFEENVFDPFRKDITNPQKRNQLSFEAPDRMFTQTLFVENEKKLTLKHIKQGYSIKNALEFEKMPYYKNGDITHKRDISRNSYENIYSENQLISSEPNSLSSRKNDEVLNERSCSPSTGEKKIRGSSLCVAFSQELKPFTSELNVNFDEKALSKEKFFSKSTEQKKMLVDHELIEQLLFKTGTTTDLLNECARRPNLANNILHKDVSSNNDNERFFYTNVFFSDKEKVPSNDQCNTLLPITNNCSITNSEIKTKNVLINKPNCLKGSLKPEYILSQIEEKKSERCLGAYGSKLNTPSNSMEHNRISHGVPWINDRHNYNINGNISNYNNYNTSNDLVKYYTVPDYTNNSDATRRMYAEDNRPHDHTSNLNELDKKYYTKLQDGSSVGGPTTEQQGNVLYEQSIRKKIIDNHLVGEQTINRKILFGCYHQKENEKQLNLLESTNNVEKQLFQNSLFNRELYNEEFNNKIVLKKNETKHFDVPTVIKKNSHELKPIFENHLNLKITREGRQPYLNKFFNKIPLSRNQSQFNSKEVTTNREVSCSKQQGRENNLDFNYLKYLEKLVENRNEKKSEKKNSTVPTFVAKNNSEFLSSFKRSNVFSNKCQISFETHEEPDNYLSDNKGVKLSKKSIFPLPMKSIPNNDKIINNHGRTKNLGKPTNHMNDVDVNRFNYGIVKNTLHSIANEKTVESRAKFANFLAPFGNKSGII